LPTCTICGPASLRRKVLRGKGLWKVAFSSLRREVLHGGGTVPLVTRPRWRWGAQPAFLRLLCSLSVITACRAARTRPSAAPGEQRRGALGRKRWALLSACDLPLPGRSDTPDRDGKLTVPRLLSLAAR